MQKDVVFLSDRLARKMFDQENPIGKVISYNKEIELTVKGTYADIPENATVRPDAVISLPTVWSRGWGNYSWRGGDSWIAFIRFRPGADKSVVNARLNDLIKKYRPAEDQKVVGYTAFVKPIRDVYREEPDVKRMRNIMSILGIIILFIATLNYVLISISSLSYRAKAIGVHKCSGAGSGKILGMFLLETAIIILFALLLMGLILLNFRDFIEDTTAVELGALFLFRPSLGTPADGSYPVPHRRSTARTHLCQNPRFTSLPPLHRRKKRMETPAIIRAVCRRSFHLRIDVCGDAAILLCLKQRPGIQSEARCRSQY